MVSPSHVRLSPPPSTLMTTLRGTRLLRRDSREAALEGMSDKDTCGEQPMNTKSSPSYESAAFETRLKLCSRSRVSSEAFERLEPREGKLSRTVLRGLGGSNPARLLDRGWVLFCDR